MTFLSAFVEAWADRHGLVGRVEEHPARNEYAIQLTDPVVDEYCAVYVSRRDLVRARYDRAGVARALAAELDSAHRQMVARAEGAPA